MGRGKGNFTGGRGDNGGDGTKQEGKNAFWPRKNTKDRKKDFGWDLNRKRREQRGITPENFHFLLGKVGFRLITFLSRVLHSTNTPFFSAIPMTAFVPELN